MLERVDHNLVSNTRLAGRPTFTWAHCVSFEETNVVGNVYFARHLSWQGKCREMFLKEYAPSTLEDLNRDLRLVTITVKCDYFEEVFSFDEIIVEMRLSSLNQNRIELSFTYLKIGKNGEVNQCFAQGAQEIGCMRLDANGVLTACDLPQELRLALEQFS